MEVPEKIKGTPLEKAFLVRQANAAAGIKTGRNVPFTAEESARLAAGAAKTDLIEGSSVVDYVKAVALAQADLDAAKPVKPRTTKTKEQLVAEAAALADRIAKMG